MMNHRREATVPDMLSSVARDLGERIAVEDIARDRLISYRGLDARASAVAGALIRRSVEPGETVAVLSANRAEWLELLYGCARAGISLIPIPETASRAEAISILTHASPRLLFFSRSLEEKAFSLSGPDVGLIDFDEPGEDGYEAFLSEGIGTDTRDRHPARECWYVIPRIEPDTTVSLVTVSHETAFLNALVMAPMAELRHTDRHLPLLPFSSGEGLALLTLPHLAQGGRILTLDPCDHALILDLLIAGRVDTLSSDERLLDVLSADPRGGLFDPSLVRYWALSGGQEPSHNAETLRARGAMLAHMRFLAIAGGPLLIRRNEGLDGPLTSRTHPHIMTELRGDDGGRVRAGEIGALHIAGHILSDGQLVHQALEPSPITSEGWHATGLLAVQKAEGGMEILGRAEDAFRSAGALVIPAEIERLIRSHPAIADACVIGIDNNQLGQVGRAYLSLRPGRDLRASELRAFLSERIAAHKVPREFYLSGQQMRDTSGFIQRARLTGTPLR